MMTKQYRIQSRKNVAGLRSGSASVEYMLVCTLVCIICIGAIYVLGESLTGVYRVGDRIATINRMQHDPAQHSFSSGEAELMALGSEKAIHVQSLAIASTLCLLTIGFFYIRLHGKRRVNNFEDDVCEVSLGDSQSDALSKILGKRSIIHSILRDDWVQLFEGDATIEPYMSTELVTVRPDMKIEDCNEVLKENGYRRAMVTDENGKMAGVVSRKDMVLKRGETVSDVMTSDPKTAEPTTSLRIALSILLQHRVSCLPILKDGFLVGLLSTSDLLIVLQCILVILDDKKNTNLTDSKLPDAFSTDSAEAELTELYRGKKSDQLVSESIS